MKIISCHLENFASYKVLDFNFDSQGLSLIHGATGSGKSTLCDAIPWVLFGKTAKNGSVSDVLSWNSDNHTEGTIYLDNPKITSVTRIRGPKSGDLYYETMSLGRQRGKDILDTQKLINNLLGVDCDLYLSGAYFHEFSQTAQFFITTPKNRRVICEQLVDLSLPVKLQEQAKSQFKELSVRLDDLELETYKIKSNIEMLVKLQDAENSKALNWTKSHEIRLQQAEINVIRFEDNRIRRISQLVNDNKTKLESKTCSECGAVKQQNHVHKDNTKDILKEQTAENPHLEQAQNIKREENPHSLGAKDFSDDIKLKNKELADVNVSMQELVVGKTDLEILSDIIAQFRSILIKNTILDIETQTNLYLSNHFDAEIKINLSIEESDKLEVNIQKDGNTCSYTQLSKGQRQLLKLSFGIAVMRAVSNHHGVKFEQIFLDECLDGLDDAMKLKAVGLLETLALEYESVFFVEHSETIKAMVNSRYHVQLINGNSVINEET